MIPKIIYHIWISDKPCPESFKKYTDTWSKVMPDYKIVYVVLDNCPRNKVIDTLIENKRWALVNHYVRYLMLYKFGGIYLDLDIEVVKSFDDLLDRDLIIGREDETWINNAVMGCIAGHEMMKDCLDTMGVFDYTVKDAELKTGPRLVTALIKGRDVLDSEYFYPYHYTKKFTPECIKEKTHAIHQWNASWKQ